MNENNGESELLRVNYNNHKSDNTNNPIQYFKKSHGQDKKKKTNKIHEKTFLFIIIICIIIIKENF